MELILPFPPAIINKNSRAHWMQIANMTKRAKAIAFRQTVHQLENGALIPAMPWKLVVLVFPKNKRRRDLDNISIKPYLDGLIDAFNYFGGEIDDNMAFIPAIEMKFGGVDPNRKGFITLRLACAQAADGIF